MSGIFVELLPYMIAAAAAPIWIILVLMLLRGEGGLGKGAAFAAGAVAGRMLQGVIGLYFFGGTAADDEGGGVFKATILTLLGLLLLISAYRTWANEPDADAPPPKWMNTLEQATPLRTFLFGAVAVLIAPKMWVFGLGAVSVIGQNDLEGGQALLAYLVYVIGATLLVLLPVLLRAVAPERSGAILESIGAFLDRHNRIIAIVVALLFGVLFLWQGLSALLS
jgi:hypothetical protein